MENGKIRYERYTEFVARLGVWVGTRREREGREEGWLGNDFLFSLGSFSSGRFSAGGVSRAETAGTMNILF